VVVRGTGNPSAQIPGYTTAGKTGTAQIVANGRYEPGAYAASFIGMIPYEHPRYLIYVKLERPQGAIYGGVVAAPAFVEIARSAMMHNGVLPAPSPDPNVAGNVGGPNELNRRSAKAARPPSAKPPGPPTNPTVKHSAAVDDKRLVPRKRGAKH